MHIKRRLLLGLLPVVCAVAAVSGFSANAKERPTHISTNGLGTIKLTSAQYTGEQLFTGTCGACHTLSAAHTHGKVGPNLDDLRPPAPAVIATINSGMGKMPAHLLRGTKERDVASFVAAVTAH